MFINTHVLSEPKLYTFLCKHLSDIFNHSSKMDIDGIEKITYTSWYQRYNQFPDQAFHGHWQNLLQRKQEENSFCRALLAQAARYHLDTDDSRRIAVRMNRFDQWQSWLANQSGLPVIAFQLASILPSFSSAFEQRSRLKNILGYRSLISPFHPLVEAYIEQTGLNETHMHLNGTTTMEAMWHFSLCNPETIVNDLHNEYQKSKRVQLLYAVTPELDHPKKYAFLLLLARRLRQLFIAWVEENADLQQYMHDVHELLKDRLINKTTNSTRGYTLETNRFGSLNEWTHISEIDLHISIIKKLKTSSSETMDTCYLLYLLCMNCFQRVLVQRDDQFGFDQFQKFADDGIRETFEKDYKARFFQLHGPNPGAKADLLTLEGRFAPKREQEKNIQLISSILRGFIGYCEKSETLQHNGNLDELASKALSYNHPALRLIAHFIKQKWENEQSAASASTQEAHYQEPHFFTLRKTLQENGQLLFDLLTEHPKLREIITGVDAAANELETPPEVFSVLFRNCQRHGIQHFTYHVGEDFEHLLSGIRAVYEAVEFLNLRNGDRIGHATAIGISPQLWLDKMPDNIFISQGQWLENLLFLRHIALEPSSTQFSLAHIEAAIHKLAWEIFDTQVNINILQLCFSHRDLDPEIVQDVIKDNPCIYSGWRKDEYARVKKIKKDVLELLALRWFNKSVIEKYEKKQEFRIDFTPFEILLNAQQYVQKIISERCVVVETLPTSNVRISHYNSIKEHHVFRWMSVPSRIFGGDYPMIVSLGSDDPGIFVTDMRNEFYHLFSTLINEFKYSESQALDAVARLNENGKVYRFDYRQNKYI